MVPPWLQHIGSVLLPSGLAPRLRGVVRENTELIVFGKESHIKAEGRVAAYVGAEELTVQPHCAVPVACTNVQCPQWKV